MEEERNKEIEELLKQNKTMIREMFNKKAIEIGKRLEKANNEQR